MTDEQAILNNLASHPNEGQHVIDFMAETRLSRRRVLVAIASLVEQGKLINYFPAEATTKYIGPGYYRADMVPSWVK